tara:strand:- start:47 stop:775 length:729 start_codon:yes stop_codon:yes gene_type:complete
MIKNINYILFLLLISCGKLIGPDSHGDSLGNGDSHPNPIGNNEIIEATSYSAWKYYKITQDSLKYIPFVLGGYEDSNLWDIAFQRYHIRTNSGTSGSKDAGVYVDSIETWNGTIFNSLDNIETNFDYIADTTLNTFYNITTHEFSEGSTNPLLETWARIDTTNNYSMIISNNKFIVRTSDGNNFYKFWIRDYYNENSESGHISLVYDFICTLDCTGECGGDAQIDACGECDGSITDPNDCNN